MIENNTPISIIILSNNESDNIAACIKSANFANEIIVLDSGSTDGTEEIAKSLGAKVFNRPLNNDFSQQRNFGIKSAVNEWVFMLDCDERITESLAKEIKLCVENNSDITYTVSRENHFVQGKALHGILRPDRVERLFKKTGAYYEGIIHERLKSPYPKCQLHSRLIHFPYKSWETHLSKMNKYTTLLAQKYHEKGKKCCFVRDIIFKPIWAFIKVYFIHLGFLDGKLGIVFSLTHYFYTIEKYVKLDSLNKYKGRI